MEASLFQTISGEVALALGALLLLTVALYWSLRRRWIQTQIDRRVQQFRKRLSPTLVLPAGVYNTLQGQLADFQDCLAVQKRAERHLESSASDLRLPCPSRMTTKKRLSALRDHFRTVGSGLESTTRRLLPELPKTGSGDLEKSLQKYLSQIEIYRVAGGLGRVASDKHTLETGKRLLKKMKEAKASGARAGGYLDDSANVSDDLVANNLDDLLLASADDLQASSLLLSGADDVVTAGTDDLLAGSLDDLANLGPIPVVTLVFSGGREARWLIDGSTNADDALRNILYDLAGTGIGSLYGGLLGTAFGPWGTALGAAVGGYIGRKISDASKFEPVTEAGSAYRSGREVAKGETVAGANRLFETVSTDCARQADELLRKLESTPKPDLMPITACAVDFRKALRAEIRMAHKTVREFYLRESAAVPEDPLKLWMFGFAIRSQTCRSLESAAAQMRRQLRDLERSLPGVGAIEATPLRCIAAMLSKDTLLFSKERQSSAEVLQAQAVLESILDLAIREHRIKSLAWGADAAKSYASAVRKIQANSATALGSHMKVVRENNARVEKLKTDFMAQLDRFHIKHSIAC